MPLAWQWNHNPDNRFWSVSERPGFLRLTTGRVDADFFSARNTLTQRTFGPTCSASVSIDVSHLRDGDVAGLAALQRDYGLVGVALNGNKKSIMMRSAADGSVQEHARLPLEQDTVDFRIDCDFRDRADQARFYHSLDGETWMAIGEPLAMKYTLPHFMGYRFALFNYATKQTGGRVDFDFFRIGDELVD